MSCLVVQMEISSDNEASKEEKRNSLKVSKEFNFVDSVCFGSEFRSLPSRAPIRCSKFLSFDLKIL